MGSFYCEDGLVGSNMGLFCGHTELFCGHIGFFCRDNWLVLPWSEALLRSHKIESLRHRLFVEMEWSKARDFALSD